MKQNDAQRSDAGCDKGIEKLRAELNLLKSAVVAFSGGVDSAFLLAAAAGAGLERLLALTIDSPFVTRAEIQRTREITASLGVEHRILELDVMSDDAVTANTPRRCYHCKARGFGLIRDAAKQEGITHLLQGVNRDDMGDYRPGLEAANELTFQSPLLDGGWTKSEIRACAREMGLSVWDLPSQSCLATRIPLHEPITREKLALVEQAEEYIKSLGFPQVRVRCHSDLARIETPPDAIGKMVEKGEAISAALKKLGFSFVSIDLEGYETGKMNQTDTKETT